MYKITTLNNISAKGLINFTEKYNIVDDVEEADGILLRSFDMHDMELSDKLLAVARAGAGTNNIPIDKCSEKGIVVFNTPGANANAVKELVLAGLFLSSRKIARAIDWTKTLVNEGDNVDKLVEDGKKNFAGSEIKGKTLGVVGLGAIGVMVANAASSLGMNVVGYDPFMSVNSALELSRKIKLTEDLDQLFSASDYITIHVPAMDATKGMFNKEKFAIMKEGVKILNFSRGSIVNDTDMIDAINLGIVSRYVTDFPTAELIAVENVVAIPHLGASTPESEENCAIMAVDEIMDYLEYGNITNSVNFPNCSLGAFTSEGRIGILHKNIPAMIGKITSIMADHNINISDMNNRSKGELAYTLIDTDTKVTTADIDKLKSIDGIINVRVMK